MNSIVRKNRRSKVKPSVVLLVVIFVEFAFNGGVSKAEDAPETPAGARNFYQVLDELLSDLSTT